MDDKTKKLRRMATWTAAIFATIFAVTFAVLWLPYYGATGNAVSAIGKVFVVAWPVLVLDLVLCVGLFLGYSAYVKHQK
jgi:cytochrome b subunit of formate dehydrogenase